MTTPQPPLIRWRKSSYSTDNGGCVEVGAGWRTSSYSTNNGDCVEVGAGWLTSSYSTNNGACVEVGPRAAQVRVRDTKDRDGGTLTFGAAQWQAFLTGVLDRPGW